MSWPCRPVLTTGRELSIAAASSAGLRVASSQYGWAGIAPGDLDVDRVPKVGPDQRVRPWISSRPAQRARLGLVESAAPRPPPRAAAHPSDPQLAAGHLDGGPAPVHQERGRDQDQSSEDRERNRRGRSRSRRWRRTSACWSFRRPTTAAARTGARGTSAWHHGSWLHVLHDGAMAGRHRQRHAATGE